METAPLRTQNEAGRSAGFGPWVLLRRIISVRCARSPNWQTRQYPLNPSESVRF